MTGSLKQGITITRMLIAIAYQSGTIADISDVTYGIGIFNDKVTAATVPDPTSDPFDWLFWTRLRGDGRAIETAAGTFTKLMQGPLIYDVRSQRKMGPNEVLKGVMVEGASGAMTLAYSQRTLYRLP